MVAHQQQRGRTGQQAKGTMQSMTESVGQMGQSVGHAVSHPTETVQEYPFSSMLVVFGVGMGLGVVLSQALIPSFHEPTMSERMGRQLYDSMSNLTSAVQRGFKAYT